MWSGFASSLCHNRKLAEAHAKVTGFALGLEFSEYQRSMRAYALMHVQRSHL